MSSSSSFIAVHPSLFDKSRLHIAPHESSTFTKSNQKFTNIKSGIFYRVGADGVETYKKLYLIAPTQQVFGFSEQYELGKPELPINFRGYQVGYPVSASTTPTAEEKQFNDVLDIIYNAVVDAGKLEVEKHSKLIKEKKPSTFYGNAVGSFSQATACDDMTHFIKPMLTQPMVAGSNPPVEDMTKPKRLYISLVGRKDTGTSQYVVSTQIYGPGNKLLNVSDHVSRFNPKSIKRGMLTPLIDFSHVYWGAHGSQPYAGSIKMNIVQCNYVPVSASSVPTKSLLPPVEGVAEENETTTENHEEGDGENEFDHEDAFATPSTATLAQEVANVRRTAPVEPPEQSRPVPVSVVPTESQKAPPKPRVTKTAPKA